MKKKVVVSSILSACLMMPVFGFEVYNNDDTKVEVYGSIRAYVGAGASETNKMGHDTGFMLGIQNNSNFGVRFQSDKFRANVEFGALETGFNGVSGGVGYRQFWGSYDTNFGTFLFGKTNTPSIDPGFASDWVANDSGSEGFGGLATAFRRIQVQYMYSGFAVALVEDEIGNGRGDNGRIQGAPRISASYTIKNDDLLFRVAGSYKYYNSGELKKGVPAGTNAYHLWAGVKPKFGKMFVSAIAHYGMNGHLYGEQMTTYNIGTYGFKNSDDTIGLDAQRAGARLEFGVNLTDDLAFVIGGGYQATFGGKMQNANSSGVINNSTAFVQLPYKVSKNLALAPQVSYYETAADNTRATIINGKRREAGVIAGMRVRWDF